MQQLELFLYAKQQRCRTAHINIDSHLHLALKVERQCQLHISTRPPLSVSVVLRV